MLFVGKYLKLRCLSKCSKISQNVQQFPDTYYANTKSLLTSDIQEKWFRNIDSCFPAEKRKILLVVGNYTAHLEDSCWSIFNQIQLIFTVEKFIEKWFRNIDSCFSAEKRKVLLIVGIILRMQKTHFGVSPTKCNLFLQRIDYEIFNNFKQK